jgi:short-subunit dehydrogenase
MLVNNAGFGVNRRFQQTSPALLEAMIQVHIVALTRLTRTALPLLLVRDRSSIINGASTAAFLADPGSIWNTYAATKAFVLTFTVGLHEDVRRPLHVSPKAPAGPLSDHDGPGPRADHAAIEAVFFPVSLPDDSSRPRPVA